MVMACFAFKTQNLELITKDKEEIEKLFDCCTTIKHFSIFLHLALMRA